MIRKTVTQYKRTVRTYHPDQSYRTDRHTELVQVETWWLFWCIPVYRYDRIIGTNM